MPRPENTSAAGIAKAMRQAKYRSKLQQLGEPEADRVDTAIAQACVGLLAHVDAERIEPLKPALHALIKGVLDLLESDGFERGAAGKVLRRRMSSLARPEISQFVEKGQFHKRLKNYK
ncbi:hypothetical protein [Ochrobactrum sp. A-1]|uniref:hypothetical protein n=1 Tax=Ochrobactrum sp. A-1 TaxID=2920940 RepID=UPI001F0B2D26|nr:hypothetical protein [Ochrobactrum sp. A-1]